jgi:hypothetical protein
VDLLGDVDGEGNLDGPVQEEEDAGDREQAGEACSSDEPASRMTYMTGASTPAMARAAMVPSAMARSVASAVTRARPGRRRTRRASAPVPTVAGSAYAATASAVHTPGWSLGAMRIASHATATRLIPSPIADNSIAGRTRRSTGRPSTRPSALTCDRKISGAKIVTPQPQFMSTYPTAWTWLPDGARNARSRAVYAWSVGLPGRYQGRADLCFSNSARPADELGPAARDRGEGRGRLSAVVRPAGPRGLLWHECGPPTVMT